MDRVQVYRGEIPYESDLLGAQQFAYEGQGLLALDLIGSLTAVSGLACAPTSPASLAVKVGPGRIYAVAPLDTTALGQLGGTGGLGSDTNADHQLLKQGLHRDTETFAITPPVTGGQSQVYLIQAQFQEVDDTAVISNFYNVSVPSAPIERSVSPARRNKCVLNLKAGTAAPTGTQVTPTADVGWTPLWNITVANGATSIVSGNIAQNVLAPLLSGLASLLNPTFSGLVNIAGALNLSAPISPAQITGNVNDYAPAGVSTAVTVRVTTDAQRFMTGLQAPSGEGGVKIIRNVGVNDLVLANQSTSSTAANRFNFGFDRLIGPGRAILLVYDAISGCWRDALPSDRRVLYADRTFYVSTTGSDTNDGLTAGTPWLTRQHAVDVLQKSYDLAGYNAIIQCADGTYTDGVVVTGPFVGQTGSNIVIIQGNLVTPANCFSNVTNGSCFSSNPGGLLRVRGFKVAATGTGAGQGCGIAAFGGAIQYDTIEFGACDIGHVFSSLSSLVSCTGACTITAGSRAHLYGNGGSIVTNGYGATLTGTPAFSTAFAFVNFSAPIYAIGSTYSGAATGVRYSAQLNGVILTGGGGASFFPGNSAGSTSTGGQYQ